MDKINLNELNESTDRPSRLEVLTILKSRSPELFAEHEKLFNCLYIGNKGKIEAIKYFKEFGRQHWRFVRNYWADYQGSFESDLIVFTSNSYYVFKIKNYTGHFEYSNGISTVDGYDFNSDGLFRQGILLRM